METTPDTPNKTSMGFSLKLDYRIIIFILLATITAMLFIWKPWSPAPGSDDRTITVTGDATLKETPDEYLFYPSYTVKNADSDAGLEEVSTKSNEITNKLKELGVPESDIKNESSGYKYNYYYNSRDNTTTYTLRLIITVHDLEMAQKVQDYLITTNPEGRVTPQAQFSEAKRKELESKARDQATTDARAKADQSAKNLGFKVGKVKSVDDDENKGLFYPLSDGVGMATEDSSRSSLQVLPGENELTYSVTVVYYMR